LILAIASNSIVDWLAGHTLFQSATEQPAPLDRHCVTLLELPGVLLQTGENQILDSFQEHSMSAPSRRPEIRRRRTRKEKILQLRKRLAAAKTDADRTRLTAKLHKLSIASPGQPLLK
jgi:hypothetical protein